MRAVIKKYGKAERYLWVQEEPKNMGAWPHILMHAQDALGITFECISRPASGAPATGSSKRSANQQLAIIEQAFAKSATALGSKEQTKKVKA
jgi:2-oxoglutarate dehydrogenase E1 component